MKKLFRLKALIYLLVLGLIVFAASKVLATDAVHTEIGNYSTVGDYVSALLRWARPIIITLAVFMFIIAGYMYMTSQGNPDQIKKAKEIIIGVVLGLALLYLAGLLFNAVGVNLNFTPVNVPGGASGGSGGGSSGGGGGGSGGGGGGAN